MKLYFMKDEALIYFKENIIYNIDFYKNDSNEWIYEKYPQGAFKEFKAEFNELKMDMSSEKPEKSDYNNVKIIYNCLKNLTDTQATDERLWTGLSHGQLWEFTKYRIKSDKIKIDEKKILNNYFYKNALKRSLILHPIARLWWVGRLLYDENSKNPYRALEYLRSDFGSKVLQLFSSNYSNNPKISRALLVAIDELEKEFDKRILRDEYLELIRYLNLLGGVIILDYLSEDELKNKIISHYKDRYK